jgi:hypothetical protein
LLSLQKDDQKMLANLLVADDSWMCIEPFRLKDIRCYKREELGEENVLKNAKFH